jgi:C1A family cysteine protease
MLSAKFMEHIVTFGQQYHTVEEYEMRRDLFSQVDDFITLHNQTNASFMLGHNQFSTMTEAEKVNTRGLEMPELLTVGEPLILAAANADSVDWRSNGAVNPIQDQGQCGSCWAFSTMASLEGEHAIATGTLEKFAEQQLVDCSTTSHGCNGGSMALAFLYLKSHDAILESNYPYTAADGTCQYDSLSHTAVETTGYSNVQANSPDQLKSAVEAGVVSVAIEADKLVFQHYTSGIFDSSSCGTQLDHGVALVGYGVESGTEYFILRNSWNTTWGEEGYMKIASTSGAGICGVNSAAVYPKV